MGSGEKSGKWFLVTLATAADVAGIISFLGIQASIRVRVLVAIGLCLVAFVAAASTLFGWIRLWFSPRGSYYPGAFHFKRLALGIFAALVAIGFSVYVITALHGQPVSHNPKKPHSHPTPTKTINISHACGQLIDHGHEDMLLTATCGPSGTLLR